MLRRYLNAERVKARIVAGIRVRILTEEAITELIVLVSEEIDARAGGLGGQPKAIEAELADVRRRPERLYEALETMELTIQALSPRILALRQREDQLAAAQEDRDRQLRQRKPDLPTSAEIAEYVADFRRFLESGTFLEREAPIRKFVKSIEVVDGNATLTYTMSMTSDGVARGDTSVPDCVESGPPFRRVLIISLERCSVDGPDSAALAEGNGVTDQAAAGPDRDSSPRCRVTCTLKTGRETPAAARDSS